MGHFDLIVLTFREPMRGRDARAGYLPSDTLWSALYAADARLQGSVLPLEQPYRVSSAFPFVGGEWLLPKPRVSAKGEPQLAKAGTPSDKKKAKNLNYVRLHDFLALARGERLSNLDEALAVQRRALLPVRAGLSALGISEQHFRRAVGQLGHLVQGQSSQSQPAQARKPDADTLAQAAYGCTLSALSDAERLHLLRHLRGRAAGGAAERQRNAQDRVNSTTTTFMTASVTQPRLGFLLYTTSAEQRGRLLMALNLLADDGLGGLRTQGSGQFEYELRALPASLQPHLNRAGPQVLLNLTCPSSSEAQAIDAAPDQAVSYALVRRDGFLDGTGLQRQDLWMLSEGSLVPVLLSGTLANVAPPDYPHAVWRSGLSLSLGVTT